MQSYITKPKSIKRREVVGKEWSFSTRDFRFIESKNKNKVLLKDLLIENIKGFEPGSAEYITFTDNHFIRISEMSDLSFTFDISNDTKKIKPVDGKNAEKFIQKGNICYQTASNVGNVCFYDGQKAFYNSHIRKLDFKDNKYYIFAFLKSQFCKSQVDIYGSIKGVDNFREEYLLNTEIAFPTPANNPNPKAIEELVSCLVQNIIDKEEQIKAKNAEIDRQIEVELCGNQKRSNFVYSMPKISEIKQEGRLDTGLYTEEFKKIDNLIKCYGGGCINFENAGFTRRKGPNLAISVIGESYYSENKLSDSFKLLILSKNVSDSGGLISKQYIGSKEKLPELKQFDFLLFARGDIGRVILIDDELIGATSNFDVFFISSKKEYWENVFVLCWLKYLKAIKFWNFYGVGGSGAASLTDYYFQKINIPLFPVALQQQIARLYYNKIDKNSKLTLENYLEKEKVRNRQAGIFQLNMEIFALREKLESIVHKIVMEERIEIEF